MKIPYYFTKRAELWDIMIKMPDGAEKTALRERINIMTAIIKGQLPI